jgi:uncharacterized protein YegL
MAAKLRVYPEKSRKRRSELVRREEKQCPYQEFLTIPLIFVIRASRATCSSLSRNSSNSARICTRAICAAQADFVTLQQLGPQGLSTSTAQSSSPLAQAFKQLSQDLSSGNLSAAQQDYV